MIKTQVLCTEVLIFNHLWMLWLTLQDALVNWRRASRRLNISVPTDYRSSHSLPRRTGFPMTYEKDTMHFATLKLTSKTEGNVIVVVCRILQQCNTQTNAIKINSHFSTKNNIHKYIYHLLIRLNKLNICIYYKN